MALTQLEKAIALAGIGFFVFPCREKTSWVKDRLFEAKAPYTERGVLEATTSREQIEKWWKRWPDALVGVNVGKSGAIVLDIDLDDELGTDGYYYLTALELETPETFGYRTPRGGEHRWYADTVTKLGPTQNHLTPDGRRIEGVDRRAGNAYAVWWADEVPWDRPEMAEPPSWLLTPNRSGSGAEFNGTPDTWLEGLEHGEPDERVLRAIERIEESAPRDDMLKRQRELIGLGAEGHPGVPDALDVLRGFWFAREHVSGDPHREWAVALLDGIKKFGGKPAPESDEPDKTIATRISQEVTDERLSRMFFEEGGRDDRRKFIRGLLGLGYEPDDVFATVYHLPMRGDMTAKQLNQEVHELHNPPPPELPDQEVSLLTTEERAHLETIYTFVDHYCYAVSINQRPWNMAYHRLNAWTILALMFSDMAWLRIGKGLNTNLFCLQIGPSGSGKSEAMYDMYGFLRAADRYAAISIDDDASEAGLLKVLINRPDEVVWFHGDEAERLLSKMKPDSRGNVVWGALQALLTGLYDTGYVPITIRSDTAKDVQKDAASTHVYFNLWEDGTEDDLFKNLTVSQVKKGFVARFITVFGERPNRTREDMRPRILDPGQDRFTRDPYVAALGREMAEMRGLMSDKGRLGLTPTEEAIERMTNAGEVMMSMYEHDPLWDMIEPNVLRISFIMWKAATLNAVSQGRMTVTLDDALVAIRATEEWLGNSLRLMRGIRGSDMAARVDKVYAEIGKTGSISASVLYRRMFDGEGLSMRDLDEILQNLAVQNRIKLERGVWKVIKDD